MNGFVHLVQTHFTCRKSRATEGEKQGSLSWHRLGLNVPVSDIGVVIPEPLGPSSVLEYIL
jgi:hypothetical protein